ncbi:MAG: SRPBCC domain-containing protein [Bacteroidales bacterium]|nr:SRPBCC domain-containing protein [Bacteroidales bacterium]
MKDFKFQLTIKDALPEEVYNALTNPFAIELWSGYPAVMHMENNAEFSMWEGDIVGRILSFIPNQMIEQEWFFDDNQVPSIATIKLHLQKKTDTYIVLEHNNIPDDDFENITEGWKEYYLGAIKLFFEEA